MLNPFPATVQDTAVRLGTSLSAMAGFLGAHFKATPRYTSKLNVGRWKLNLVLSLHLEELTEMLEMVPKLSDHGHINNISFQFQKCDAAIWISQSSRGFPCCAKPGICGPLIIFARGCGPLEAPKIRPQWFDGCIVERMFVGCAERKGSIRVYMNVCLEGRESASAIPYLSFNVWVRDSC